MINIFKNTLFLSVLVTSFLVKADLINVRNMTQTYPGSWRITCQDGAMEKGSTSAILSNNICLREQEDRPLQKCYRAATAPLGRFEYDELKEIKQLKDACRHGNFEVPSCIKATISKLGRFEADDRKEVIEIIHACSGGKGYVNQCLRTSQTGLGRFENDERKEMIELIHACRQARKFTKTCIKRTFKDLSRSRYDDRSEVISIINSCSK